MASSQVEVASSSSPASFGCVMRNHSRRERCSSGGSNSFPDNLKDLVHSCISGDPRKSNADADEKVVDLTDLWVHKPQYNNNNNNDRNSNSNSNDNGNSNGNAAEDQKSPKKSGGGKSGSENWERARKKVLSSGRREEENEGLEAQRVVSSIVKRWKDFEAEKKTPQPQLTNSSSTCSTRTNSAATLLSENVEIPPAPASSVACDESSDGTDTPTNDADSSFADWESDRRVMSAPPSIRGRDSDATESERVRVIDIIKKLTSSGGEESHDRDHNNTSANAAAMNEAAPPLPRVKTSASEHGCLCPLIPSSPRKIRGRRAFTDLLMQMERERVRELESISGRKAVSKFQQKGRIQAMLKLKLLRRETEVKDSAPTNCMSPQSIKCTQSSIMHLREKFKTDSKPTSKEADCSNSPDTCNSRPAIPTCKRKNSMKEREKKEKKENNTNASTTSKQEENHHHQQGGREAGEKTRPPVETINTQATTDLSNQCSKDITKSDQIKVCQNCQQTDSNISPKESSKKPSKAERALQVVIPELTEAAAETTKPSACSKSEETGSNVKEQQRNSLEWTNDWDENDWGWIRDFSQHTHNGWDRLRLHFQPHHHHQEDVQKRVISNEEEASHEWINDVSRPRSEWEDLRQARYQEMLDPYFNNDLQQLLQRKSVSNFLSGGLRDKIDQLMMTRSQKQSPPENHEIQKQVTDNKGEKAVEEGVQSGGERKTCQEEDEYGDGNDSTQTWSNNQECDIRDDYDQMASTALPQFQSSTFFSQENEMKLIHGLMGHMEQLHQEMSEIRRALISCIDMQVKLQNSIKDEVVSAFNQLGKDNVKVPSEDECKSKVDECKSKRNCIMCHEMVVNALLYRCGHMITCYKCAQELQWGDGKCPVCQAPIMDVVRACVDA
ncbi:PREDICTED: serine/threonine-protein kinase pakD-like [Ipomoea nil]|uniref:serine/threonine-protein kinase pakD-like n=1 Tax=Ipomoea nil TaxID=35883 RepID=UPI000901BFE3|nr:PREDICTED: serine/threonine-protein kinase pakD-like [Ipomoea nil]